MTTPSPGPADWEPLPEPGPPLNPDAPPEPAPAPAPLSMRDELLGPTNRNDPWAHRRGEPRIFAFFWTLFVLIAVAGSLVWVARFAVVTSGTYGPAGRIMLMVVAVGATVLWPMVRLSQASPPRPVVGHIAADAWIVLLPIQIVLWPLVFLANWPLNVVGGVAAVFVVWTALAGGVLAVALAGRRVGEFGSQGLVWRTIWMLILLVAVLSAPALMLGCKSTGVAVPDWLAMLSPITSIGELTGRGMSGPQHPVSGVQWEFILGIGLLAVALWLTAFVRDRLGLAEERA